MSNSSSSLCSNRKRDEPTAEHELDHDNLHDDIDQFSVSRTSLYLARKLLIFIFQAALREVERYIWPKGMPTLWLHTIHHRLPTMRTRPKHARTDCGQSFGWCWRCRDEHVSFDYNLEMKVLIGAKELLVSLCQTLSLYDLAVPGRVVHLSHFFRKKAEPSYQAS